MLDFYESKCVQMCIIIHTMHVNTHNQTYSMESDLKNHGICNIFKFLQKMVVFSDDNLKKVYLSTSNTNSKLRGVNLEFFHKVIRKQYLSFYYYY